MTARSNTSARRGSLVTAQTFESLNPANGDVVGTHPVCSTADVRRRGAARPRGADWWACAVVRRAGRVPACLAGRDHPAASPSSPSWCTARPASRTATRMLEIALAIDHIAWAGQARQEGARPPQGPSGLLMANQAATVEYQPLGVDRRDRAVELPGLHPDGLDRVRAGGRQRRGVQAQRVHPRRSAQWLADAFAEVVPAARCCRWSPASARPAPRCAGPASTRSPSPAPTATGKKVMAACAETLTPVLIEGGGKDALIVDEDADIDAAAEAALWGGMANAGQTCIGIERVYVHEQVYDEFVAEITEPGQGTLHAGAGPARSGRSRCRSSST